MANLYHEDIYNFKEPIKSYWETTNDTTTDTDKYSELKNNIQTNIVVIGEKNISC